MVSRDPIPDDDWKGWSYEEYVVELDGIAPWESPRPCGFRSINNEEI